MKALNRFLLTLFLPGGLLAQQAAPAERPVTPSRTPPNRGEAAVPADDPFARQGVRAVAGEAGGGPINLINVVETWTLASADFLTLLDESPDGRVSYDRVRELAAANKARLESLIAGTSKSGQRFMIEDFDAVHYATEFSQPAAVDEIAFPVQFEDEDVGENLEAELILGPDGKTANAAIVVKDERLSGIREHRSEAAAQPVPTPDFQESRITTAVTLAAGQTRFLGTSSRTPSNEGASPEISVVFVRFQPDEIIASKVSGEQSAGSVRTDLMLFTVERAAAQKILLGSKKSAEIYAAVRALMAKGEAQLERSGSLLSNSGQRAVLDDSATMFNATEQQLPEMENVVSGIKRRPAAPTKFGRRKSGFVLEVEAVVGPLGAVIDISMLSQMVSSRGTLRMPPAFARYPSQPVYERRQIKTSLTVLNGQPGFIGTMSAPGGNGVNDRKDSGKTVLAFVRATVVKP